DADCLTSLVPAEGVSMASADSPAERASRDSALDSDQAVRKRYSAAATASEPALCCNVSYNPRHLKAIPQEIIDKDYGCGDPSSFVNPGETVLDLGSGGGKLCYIAAQIAGRQGQVIGVDCNRDMLALARKYQQEVADNLGFANTDFRCGRIQDLGLNLELLTDRWGNRPLSQPADWLELRSLEQELRMQHPLVEDNSVDCVLSNCVLNLVNPADRQHLFRELFRVLKVGGRAAISDIVSDEDVPEAMQRDGELWSGCISGAWREDRFVEEFKQAGFQGVQIAKLQTTPWHTVKGIEFRSMTVVAFKPDPGTCLERHQAVIYRGPFASIIDDDGRTYVRGQRTAVCDKTFRALQAEPYQGQFIAIQPVSEVPLENATEFDCATDQIRDPRETRGASPEVSSGNGACCNGDNCC
ncbi:MAG: methyltransferase domain-containing protein, partial [Pirellulaceae bacterium]